VKVEFIDDVAENSHKRSHKEWFSQESVRLKDVAHNCSWCDMCYTMEEDLVKHLKFCRKKPVNKPSSLEVGDKIAWSKHQCNVCWREFTCKYSLNDHLLMHTGENPFLCNTCGKRFVRQSHLNRHTLTHTQEKPHKCERCGRGFALMYHLTTHMRTHTGAKPYKCGICGEKFADCSTFRNHMGYHSGVYKYKCNECDFQTNNSVAMKTHTYTHTGERPHKCTVCEVSYVHKNSLTKHVKRWHSDGEDK